MRGSRGPRRERSSLVMVPAGLSCCFGGEHGVAIPADERGGISRADIGDLRHIRQKLIHTDQTRNRGRAGRGAVPGLCRRKGRGASRRHNRL